MNTTTTTNQGTSRSQQPSQQEEAGPMSQFSIENLRQRLEEHVLSNPVKAVGQAVAAGYILRFLPIRALLGTALRLAPPVMLLNQVLRSRQSNSH